MHFERRHDMTNKNTMMTIMTIRTMRTMALREHPERVIPEICDPWDTDHISEN